MATLARLLAGPHEPVVVVSQPDRPRGRGRKRSPSPVAAHALRAALPLLRPERVGEPELVEALTAAEPDLGVVVAFGQFLPRPVRRLPRLGYLINAHASLLPRYRGAAPIARAMMAGEERTGISVMRVEREMDAGPVGLVREMPIGPLDNRDEVGRRLAELAADSIARALDRIARGDMHWQPQDATRASSAPKIEKSELQIDWRESTRSLVHRIHALAPRPAAYTTLPADDASAAATKTSAPPARDNGAASAERRLRVLRARDVADRARAAPDEARDAPGTLRLGAASEDPPLRIATGDGWLAPLELQRAGGRALPVDAFLRGHPLADGARLGGTPGTRGRDDG